MKGIKIIKSPKWILLKIGAYILDDVSKIISIACEPTNGILHIFFVVISHPWRNVFS